MVKNFKKVNGITLVSLVITIVIMLILAAVAISLVIGKNGLFKKTNDSVSVYSAKKTEEAIELVLVEKDLDEESQNETWKEFLESRVPDELDSVTGEGPFEVEKDGYIVTVTEDGKITDVKKIGSSIQVSDIKVVRNSDGSGDNLEASSINEGTTVYVTFNASIDGGDVEIDKTLPYPVTKNGDVEFNLTGTVGEKKYTKKVIVKVNQYIVELKIGTYVKYNVSYKDMYTGYNFTSNDGWRVLNPGHNNSDGTYSGVKLVSTGIPARLHYYYEDVSSTSWRGTNIQITDYLNEFGDAPSANESKYAASGLYYNFNKINFLKADSADHNIGFYENINGKTSNDLNGSEFIAKNSGVTKIHNLTLNELNEARNYSATDTTSTKTRDVASGLLDLWNLNKFGYVYSSGSVMEYWLASLSNDSSNGIYYVQEYGEIHLCNAASSGVRPVVCLPDNATLELLGN